MYLKNDFLIATFSGVVIRSHGASNPQFYFDETAITGWTDGADVRRNTTARATTSGDFPETARSGARLITLTGGAVADTVGDLHMLRDQLTGVLSDGSYTSLSVQDGAGTRWATVGLANKVSWTQTTDKSSVFKVDLYAPDPRIYGVEHRISLIGATKIGGLKFPLKYPINFGVPVSQQTQYLSNNGNTDAWPVIVVTGNYNSGFSVTDNRGNIITYTGQVTTYSPVTIDTLTGTALQNGIDRSTFLSSRQWFSVPPGKTIQPLFYSTEVVNGWCDIIFKDTWI